MLERINAAENAVRTLVDASAVRCRVRASGVVIEIDAATLAATDAPTRAAAADAVAGIFGSRPAFEPYRNGSAFLVSAPRRKSPSPLGEGRGEGQ
jgi:uncharacterized protein